MTNKRLFVTFLTFKRLNVNFYLYICNMKITKTATDGEVTIFPSITMAASDALMERRRFSRILRKEGKVETPDGAYTIPTEYKTRRHD